MKEFGNPDGPLADSGFARGIVKGQTDQKTGGAFFKQLLTSLFANELISEYSMPERCISARDGNKKVTDISDINCNPLN